MILSGRQFFKFKFLFTDIMLRTRLMIFFKVSRFKVKPK